MIPVTCDATLHATKEIVSITRAFPNEFKSSSQYNV